MLIFNYLTLLLLLFIVVDSHLLKGAKGFEFDKFY